MKKQYEELTLEIIRFGAADIITTSDAAETTPAKEDTTTTTEQTAAKEETKATDDTAAKDNTSTTDTTANNDDGSETAGTPVYYDLDGNPTAPVSLTIVENFGVITETGEHQVYESAPGVQWYEENGNFYRFEQS
ncbi:MAG: hypothetical protein IJ179_09585 [Oscillospiraceae bacterium]|nr:hypothetical protein [Oscillospiraceae bacterium]